MSPTVLVVEDDSDFCQALCDTLALTGVRTVYAHDGRAALELIRNTSVGLVVSDVQMPKLDGIDLLKAIKSSRPDLPVLLMTAFGTIQQAVNAMREGAADFLVKPFEAEVLVAKVDSYLSASPGAAPGGGAVEMVTADPKSRALAALAERVAGSDVTVMITGESGTGKEVLSRYVHARSRRANGPFVAINCAAIPDNMLESMLFGYEKGAFTGAYKSSAGKFEQADGGTLLLDEVSEMNLGLQAKLLRVLQEREVERLGGREVIALDVRVFATSNRNLAQSVRTKRFREDLFYRLNVFPLHIAPLRERTEDVLPIARMLTARTARAGARPAPRLSDEAQARLLSHRWPGNVRELDNVMQRALVLQPGETILEGDIQFEAGLAGGELCEGDPPAEPVEEDTLGSGVKQAEYALILDALRVHQGNRKAVAEKLGISPRTLRYKLARMREAGLSPS